MLSMKFFGKFRYMIASVLLFLGVFIGISNLGINQVSAESILPYVGPGITFEQQFPNAQTASVIARQFNKVPSDEMTSADIAITSLDLYSTNLTNIDGIDIFSNLTYLDISSNQIVNLPEGLFALTKLQYLDASRNGLVVIPESIGNLFGLIYLDIGVNSLIRLPERIGDLTALKTFEVYNNQLTSLPVSMVNLVNMTYFNAQSNFLPSDYDLLLSELLGITVMRNPQESVLLSQPTSIKKISSQQDMDTIDFTTFYQVTLYSAVIRGACLSI
ncbi:leucine-rich repeat domain-containing protein [Enterococcus rivorum]|uniref:leucine-rich repeat domain-containing protein n=1 Tax=Enterococcus rivorum TaxID=762845 RepID=UPI003639FA80